MDMESPSRFTGVSTFVEVLYYLSRNGRLDQPHLLQIPFSPLQSGLRLKDVKKKLALVRGDGFPSTFAWSYKRSYKKGYVWQDLCDDDTIVATQSNEFVLKGSEIIKGATAECRHVCGYTRENISKHHLQSRANVSTQTEEVHHQSTVMEQQQDSSSVDIAVNSPTSLDKNFGHDVVVSSVAVITEKDRIGQMKLLRSLHDRKVTNHDIEATNIWTSVKSKSEYFNRRLGSTLGHLSNGLQDIVSIRRMSVSDRRTNGSRELGSQHLKMHQELNEPSKNRSASQTIRSESHRRRPLSAELYSRCMVAGAPAANVSCFPDYNQDSHVAELWHELSRYAQNMK